MKLTRTLPLFIGLSIVTLSCKDNKEENVEIENTTEVENEIAENQNEWEPLFNGENLEGWKVYNSEEEPSNWTVQDSAITFTPAEGSTGSENLISEEQYKNFELELEWKISEGGNSGIMYGVQEGEDLNEPYLTGPEIQVLDNKKHPDAKNGPIRQAGALYDMVPPSKDVTKPAGEWNKTTITINHEENIGTVMMNGEKVSEFPLHGEEWKALVENSKFKDWEKFGSSQSGHIALQDHGDKVMYRNIRIKKLD